jgi:hypothetical protein
LVRKTSTPPTGAAPSSVTVPIEDTPLTTVDGFRVNELKLTAAAATGNRNRRATDRIPFHCWSSTRDGLVLMVGTSTVL